jgi:hypothetical protein
VDTEGVKSATIKTSGHDKTHYTAISTYADGTELPSLIIVKQKATTKDKIPKGIFIHGHSKGLKFLSMVVLKDGWTKME